MPAYDKQHAEQMDGRFQLAMEARKLTWTTLTFRCQDCGKLCYASQESIDATRANDPDAYATDAEVAADFDFCLSCSDDTPFPGEVVTCPCGDDPTTCQKSQCLVDR